MREPVLPNFFVVGTGKAGTTSLYHYLRQHPQVYMSPIKEPCYFASEIRAENLATEARRHVRRVSSRPYGWIASEWEDYVNLFRDVDGETAIGEASVAYLWSETAAARIASRVPGARIVAILRDPAERAFSQYLHQLRIGLIRCSFREHIRRCMSDREQKLGVHYPFLQVGLYHEQLKRYLDRFPRDNIRIYWYEEAWREPVRLMEDVFRFLGVDTEFRPDTSSRMLERQAPRFPGVNYFAKRLDAASGIGRVVPASLKAPIRDLLFRRGRSLVMDPVDRAFLVGYYREDILKLAAQLDRDLSAWLSL